MPRIAFLTMDDLSGFVSYDEAVSDCLRVVGVDVEDVSWRSATVDWSDFELVVIRSPWDYQSAVDEFLAVLEHIEASSSTLLNPLDIVQWNVRKTYLQQLEERGVTIVPTRFVENPSRQQIIDAFDEFESDQIVIKPVVGANADDTFWLRRDSITAQVPPLSSLYAGRLALLQPFIPSVIEYGETSLIFFDGQYSHSVLKTPKAGDFRVQEEHGSRILSVTPDAATIDFAANALQQVPQQTLYARVDLVNLPGDEPAVMEIELIEPSLYLTFDEHSPDRFAAAIQRRLSPQR